LPATLAADRTGGGKIVLLGDPMRDRPTDSHRVIAANRAGRKLAPNEIVHHVDEDKSNNAESNLSVESRGAHTAAHNRARPLSKLRSSLRMVRERRKLY